LLLVLMLSSLIPSVTTITTVQICKVH